MSLAPAQLTQGSQPVLFCLFTQVCSYLLHKHICSVCFVSINSTTYMIWITGELAAAHCGCLDASWSRLLHHAQVSRSWQYSIILRSININSLIVIIVIIIQAWPLLHITHQLSFSYPLSRTFPPAASTSSSSSPLRYK